ncbi:glycoside hydrolase family 5 protein [Hyphomonas johnsonii]|uniref:Cellulase n=1 Tax=Hyphomonas johnsonii MHS-2 TaxID=1280950 RepID=A0A059FS90_9PROT|nr:glycoside hydrolase family 5 protein [Hyphomonas johnsonii]KCZ93343.1 cellulase [Hyphomonas johnsonii MHS-2]
MKKILLSIVVVMALAGCSRLGAGNAPTPVEAHGALSVQGNRIVGETGQPVSLAGVSFFWSTTGGGQEKFYASKTVRRFAKDWNASLVRAAISVDPEGGYLSDPDANLARAVAVIDGAIDEGVYVLVDWHSHRAEEHPEAAVAFFQTIARRYGDRPNLIYEIYNEPLDTADWSDVIKPYAQTVIEAIREIDPDNLIVVGTQSWSQDVDKAAADPLVGAGNVAYALHFYAGSHKAALREKAQAALDAGIALFVTEWGGVNYDGDGAVDTASVLEWMDFIRENQLSHANWAVSDKEEGASLFKPGTRPTGPWRDRDLTESGRLVRNLLATWDQAPGDGAVPTPAP